MLSFKFSPIFSVLSEKEIVLITMNVQEDANKLEILYFQFLADWLTFSFLHFPY